MSERGELLSCGHLTVALVGVCIVCWSASANGDDTTPSTSPAPPSASTQQCDPINYLSNLQVVEAGGIATLKTTWVQAYTSPVADAQGDRHDYESWAVSFGTNTLASANDASRLQLLFRSTGIYNLYFNFVGLRTNSARRPVSEETKKAIKAAFENKLKTVAPSPKPQDVAKGWKAVASDYASHSGERVADVTSAIAAQVAGAASKAATQAIKEKSGAAVEDAKKAAESQMDEGVIDCKKPIVNERLNSTDRFYVARDVSQERWEFFLSNGLGFRGLSAGSSTTTVSSGYGTFYVGLGVDGPLYTVASNSNAGFMSFELYGSYTKMNPHELATLFKLTNPPSGFETVGADFELALTGAISVKLAYAKGFGGFGKTSLGDMVMTSLALKTDALKSQ